MVFIKNIASTSPKRLVLEPLTRSAFRPFGDVIEIPPSSTSASTSSTLYPEPVSANQGTAQKYAPISAVAEQYSTRSPSRSAPTPLTSLFVCSPRSLSPSSTPTLQIPILERHPFTTQTFTPLALSPAADAPTSYIVVVAPTVPESGDPDLEGARAFVARGGQAVTYGVGTWHAPMIVVGEERVGFVVFQWVSGREREDCEEVAVEGVSVELGSESGVAVRKGPRSRL